MCNGATLFWQSGFSLWDRTSNINISKLNLIYLKDIFLGCQIHFSFFFFFSHKHFELHSITHIVLFVKCGVTVKSSTKAFHWKPWRSFQFVCLSNYTTFANCRKQNKKKNMPVDTLHELTAHTHAPLQESCGKPDSGCKVNTRQETVSAKRCVKVHCRRFRTQRTWLIKAPRVSGDSKPTHRCVHRLLAGEVSRCQTEMSLRIHSAISDSSRLRRDGGLRRLVHLYGYRMSHCCLGLMVKLWDFLKKKIKKKWKPKH